MASRHGLGIRLEDLGGIRNARQRKATKRDAGANRDFWPTHQLERFISYKAALGSVACELVPARYTSKTCSNCRRIGSRTGAAFRCDHCDHHEKDAPKRKRNNDPSL